WLGLLSLEGDGTVRCSGAAVSSALGLGGPTVRLEELVSALTRRGLDHPLARLRRQGSLSVPASPEAPASGAPLPALVLRELPEPGPVEQFLVGRPKAASLRELRLALVKEAVMSGTRLTDVDVLQSRLMSLFLERGCLALLLRFPESGAKPSTLLDTG